MNITLTPEQEQFIYRKLQSGQYSGIQDILGQAFQLLDESDEDPILTPSQQQELDRRLDRYEQDPTIGIQWEDLKSSLLNRPS
jgi:putative addiction module component (TIGR02574 family)